MDKRPEIKAYLVVVIMTAVPVLLWGWSINWAGILRNPNWLLINFGKALGISGLVLLSLNIIIATRLPIIEKIFRGLPAALRAHHRLGGAALIMLVFHPLLLTVQYLAISYAAAAAFLTPGRDIGNTLGMASLAGMILLLILTFFTQLPYHIWKFTHRFLGLVLLLAGLHLMFVNGDISRNLPLRWSLLVITGLGLLAATYRSLLSFWLVKKYQFVVEQIKPLTNQVTAVIIKPVDAKPRFAPGQFAFLSFAGQVPGPEEHPFSLCSPTTAPAWRFAIKSLGDFTQNIDQIRPGTKVALEGPYGRFSFRFARHHQQIWLAGGIGVTPFISMAWDIEPPYEARLIYSIKHKSEAILLDELNKLSQTKNNFKLDIWESAARGRLTAAKITKIVGGLNNIDFLLCGPDAFMAALSEQLIAAGVPANNIYSEKFSIN